MSGKMPDAETPLMPNPLPPNDGGLSPRTQQVADYLRGYIRERRLSAGARLPGEVELSRMLGISRPSVREASAALAAVGLIEVAPGRWPRVGTLGERLGGGVLRDVLDAALITAQADLVQVMEVRRGLEVEMAGLAAARRSSDHVAVLRATLAAMGEVLLDRQAYAEQDLQFHIALGRASANPLYPPLIADAQQAIVSNLALSLRRNAGPAELAHVQDLHEAIVDAVAEQDVSGARRAMQRHFDSIGQALARITSSTTLSVSSEARRMRERSPTTPPYDRAAEPRDDE